MGVSVFGVLALTMVAVGALARGRVWGRNPASAVPWTDAVLKGTCILVVTGTLVAYVPSELLQTAAVAGRNRPVQDLIGTTVWAIGLIGLLIGLHHLHRQGRV
jgi:hypothetical protein